MPQLIHIICPHLCQNTCNASSHTPQNVGDAEAAAKKLTDEAFARGSNDNISCIVVKCASCGCYIARSQRQALAAFVSLADRFWSFNALVMAVLDPVQVQVRCGGSGGTVSGPNSCAAACRRCSSHSVSSADAVSSLAAVSTKRVVEAGWQPRERRPSGGFMLAGPASTELQSAVGRCACVFICAGQAGTAAQWVSELQVVQVRCCREDVFVALQK